MTSRRMFLTGLFATGLVPQTSWADAGSPAYLSAARLPSGAYALCGLDSAGNRLFRIPLPGRGHAAAAHPHQPLAVSFARRPGRFALVVNCADGKTQARLDAPEGSHFYGHGVFSGDGTVLFTSENDFQNAQGMIGLWDATKGFTRIGAFASGGTGPHELCLMPDGDTLVIANGGIETHPDAGRQKLNLPDMRPNLSYISRDGALLEQHEPPTEWHQNSIRHLAVSDDGLVAIACQWQGDAAAPPPLLATHRRGAPLAFHEPSADIWRNVQGYLGSVAVSGDGREIAVTGPRGNVAVITDIQGRPKRHLNRPDICGVAPGLSGFVFTTGQGQVLRDADTPRKFATHDLAWDNHLVPIG